MIDRFEKKYAFLSNFAPYPLIYEGVLYSTSEHAYQAAKTLDLQKRLEISKVPHAYIAKRMGRELDLRSDWDDVRLLVMEEILRLKFERRTLRERLLETGDEELVEGNWWKDTFWGVYNGVGENHLGKLLMKIRSELRDGR